ncbi:WbqC family protein [Hymenobacter cellulosilyticus]
MEPYSQRRPTFEAGLSIVDVLMFNTPEQVRTMLDAIELGK